MNFTFKAYGIGCTGIMSRIYNVFPVIIVICRITCNENCKLHSAEIH